MNWIQLELFSIACKNVGLEPPAELARALHLIDVASDHVNSEPSGLLDMTDDEARIALEKFAIRTHRESVGNSSGLGEGLERYRVALVRELGGAIEPHLASMIERLQPRFAEAVSPFETAAKLGITSSSTSDDVVNMSQEAIEAWRALPAAMSAVTPFCRFWSQMAATFALTPFGPSAGSGGLSAPNLSICFAAGDNWSLDRGMLYDNKRGAPIDWLSMASGGLRLNTPDEVAAKARDRERAENRQILAAIH